MQKGAVMFKIGDLAKLCNVTIKAIRFYEKKQLLYPVNIDKWTGYRYYDENSAKRLCEILYLKNLGFTLNEIKNLDEKSIIQKTQSLKNEILLLNKKIKKLNSLCNNFEGGFKMDLFTNDVEALGKWKRICVVNTKDEFLSGKYKDQKDLFKYFQNIYFLENGQGYWCFEKWTKGKLYLYNNQVFDYVIEGDLMFVNINDKYTGSCDAVAVYQKVDNKKYTQEELQIYKDKVDYIFKNDEQVLGIWNCIDFCQLEKQFVPSQDKSKFDLVFKQLIVCENGKIIVEYRDDEILSNKLTWTNGAIIDKNSKKVMNYSIKIIDGNTYLFMQWKSGDYTYSGNIFGQYVFKKVA